MNLENKRKNFLEELRFENGNKVKKGQEKLFFGKDINEKKEKGLVFSTETKKTKMEEEKKVVFLKESKRKEREELKFGEK